MNTQYIYLLQEREFIKTKESVYTIGRTKQNNLKRFGGYPKDSNILLLVVCNNEIECEKKVIDFLKQKYIQRKDFGREYFEGDFREMIKDMMKIASDDI